MDDLYLQHHQDYVSYSFDSRYRDIVIKEYESAERLANSQSKLFQQLTSILIGIATLLISFLPVLEKNIQFLIFFLPLLCLLLLLYFAELQKTINFNVRKVVVLRKMLGLNYGPLLLVLPTWRIEGASHPTSVKLFPGLFTTVTLPFWTITLLFNVALFMMVDSLPLAIPWYYYSVFITLVFLIFFRWRLLDHHETFYLIIVRWFSKLINIHLSENFQYTIYKAKLAAYELDRLKFDLSTIKKILIIIEDKRFYQHRGVDLIALGRGLLSIIPLVRKKLEILENGGSTITMQLSRTLFINASDYRKTCRRKVTEILLAIWANHQFSKDLVLGMYLASVRYDKNTFGLAVASHHFFGEKISAPNEIHSLFFIERISNLSRFYRPERIGYLIKKINRELDINISFATVEKLYSATNLEISKNILTETG